MPWDILDRWRHEDNDPEHRRGSRRRFFVGGRRTHDNAVERERRASIEKIKAEIAWELERWARQSVLGTHLDQRAVEAVAAHAEEVMARRLPPGYRGRLVNPRIEGHQVVADGLEVERV